MARTSAGRASRAPSLALCGVLLAAWLPLLLLAGCGNSPAGTATAGPGEVEGATAPPDALQVLRANLTTEPSTLDPQAASDQVSLTLVRNLYSGLLRLDEEDELVADLAEEVPTVENGGISPDGLTYTFRLREGLLWSDGTPLAAQSFVDGARHLFRPASGNAYVDFYRMIAAGPPEADANVAVQEALAAGQEGIGDLEQAVMDGLRVEAPDDRTVVYHLNRLSPEFLLLSTLWPLYPVRQDLIDQHGDRWTEAGRLVSNGPFALEVWEPGQRIRLVRNDHWHRDPAKLEAIDFDFIDDAAVAFLAYQNDELDIIVAGPAQIAQVRNDEALRAQFQGYAQSRTVGIYVNSRDPELSDERVRQALAGSIDREQYANAVMEGNAAPAYGWLPPGIPGHEEEVGSQYRDAVEESRALLRQAGVEGAEFTLLVPEASSAVLTAEWLQAQWQTTLGLSIRLDIRETASYRSAYTAGEFQLAIGGWAADYPDPQNWLPPFSGTSPLNFGRYSNAEFDDLLARAAAETDFEDRLALYEQAHRLLVDEAGVIPLNHPLRGALVKPWVQGLVPSAREGIAPGDLFFERISIAGRP